MSGREKAHECVTSIVNRLGEIGGVIMSYEKTLHDAGYWQTLHRLKVIMEQTEKMRAELTIVQQTLDEAKRG